MAKQHPMFMPPKLLKKRPDHRVKIWVTYLLAAAALIWVLYDVEWSSLVAQVEQLSWGWLFIIVVFDVLSFYVQGVRWKILLSAVGSISSLKTTQAIYVGMFSSEILPLRAGEIIRGVLVARWLSSKFRDVLPSMALERLFDGIWFSSAMILTAMVIDVPPQIRVGTNILLGLSIVGIVGFMWAVRTGRLNNAQSEQHPVGFAGKIKFALFEVREGLKQIGIGRRFWSAFGVSGLLHVVQAIAFLSVLKACGIDLPWLPMIAVFLVVNLGIAIPNAPANVGTFQVFCVLGLTFFGIEKTTAAAFSVIAFAILTVPVLVIGAVAALSAGFSLTHFRAQVTEVEVAEGTA